MDFNIQQWIVVGIMFLITAFWVSGCGVKEDALKPTSEKVNIVEKKVVVACEVPKVECDFEGKGVIPTKKLLECVKIQKEVIRICTEKK